MNLRNAFILYDMNKKETNNLTPMQIGCKMVLPWTKFNVTENEHFECKILCPP